MKTQILNYIFDASEKTITFSDYTEIRLEQILLIINVTNNTIIYNFADVLKGGTVSNNVLTLTFDTTSMNDNDKLLIYYDDENYKIKVEEQSPLDISGLAKNITLIDGTQQTKIKETSPVDATKNNESISLSYTGSNLTTITKTINGIQYQKTLSYDDNNNLIGVSSWVQL